jgi:hypothetical protein
MGGLAKQINLEAMLTKKGEELFGKISKGQAMTDNTAARYMLCLTHIKKQHLLQKRLEEFIV